MTDFRSKRLKRIKLEAFLTCFVSLSVLFAASSATFAWFTTNKRATAKYLNIVAKDSAIVSQVSYHAINTVTTENDVTTYSFKKDTTNDLTLGRYSRALGSDEHQLLIEISLKEDTSNFTITAQADNQLLDNNGWADYGEDNWKGNPKTSGSTTTYDLLPLSFITSISYFGTKAVISENTINLKSTDGSTQSFIAFADGGDTPTYTQSFRVGTGTNSEDIYIMLDYNLSAIDSMYSYNIGNERFEQDNVDFIRDFSITLNPEN